MEIEEGIIERMRELISESRDLRVDDQIGQATSARQASACRARVAAARNIVEQLVPNPASACRREVDRIAERNHGYRVNAAVGDFGEILEKLRDDVRPLRPLRSDLSAPKH